jgi:hypothetical protein
MGGEDCSEAGAEAVDVSRFMPWNRWFDENLGARIKNVPRGTFT